MENLKKWINISLILLLIIVLIFFAINKFGVQINLPKINREYCGDKICQSNENQVNCCRDCGCPNNQFCVDNVCQENTSYATTSTVVQTTVDGTSPGGPTSPTDPSSGSSSSSGLPTETTTTIFVGCSINYCELCENATVCYDVGCVWCKVSNRCRIICKG